MKNEYNKKNHEKWIKIGSKSSSFLARHNSVHKAVNYYMKRISGIPTLLDNYKYIEHTHYGSSSYLQELERLYQRIHKKLGGIDGYIRLRKRIYKKYLIKIKEVYLKVKTGVIREQLISLFTEADDLYAWANSFLGLGTLYTDFLTRKLKDKFGRKYLDFDFSSKTEIGQYYRDLFLISKIRDKAKQEEKINNILKKYFWIGSFFFIGNELNKKQIRNDIKNIGKHRVKIKQKRLLNNSFIREMKSLSKDRNDEIEEFMEGEYYYRKLLYEVAERIEVKFEMLTYFSPKEIIACLRGKPIPFLNIKERKKLYGFLIKNGRVSEYYGNKAKFLIEKRPKATSEIIGTIAYRSRKKIKGVVKIIRTTSDIEKVKKGNILVTIMTTPNYIQAINKASAIVTDEGGITCHAAIISRELRKPCIIGTKIATKVLKDGDNVLVDAAKGMVRKI